MREAWQAVAAAIAANVLDGTSYVLTKVALAGLTEATLVVVRTLVALAVLVPLAGLGRKLHARRVHRRRGPLAPRAGGLQRRHRAEPAREGRGVRLPLPDGGRPPRARVGVRAHGTPWRGERVVRHGPHRPRRAGRPPAARHRGLRRGPHVRAPRRTG